MHHWITSRCYKARFLLVEYYPIRNLSSCQRREWLEFIGRLSKAIIGFPIISNYFQCRKCHFPDVGPHRKCQGFCALKSSEFRLKHALRNSLSMYFHYLTNVGIINGLSRTYTHIYILSRHWLILATCRPMPAQYLDIFGRKWITMHDPIRNLSSWQRREWLEFISRPSISVGGHHRLSNHFQLFPMPEVLLSRCWPPSEMPGILCFKIVGIPIKACAAQLSFHVFPLTNQY